jgi:hypothetical protein
MEKKEEVYISSNLTASRMEKKKEVFLVSFLASRKVK